MRIAAIQMVVADGHDLGESFALDTAYAVFLCMFTWDFYLYRGRPYCGVLLTLIW